MRIPLLVQSRPNQVTWGPSVYLMTGFWVIESDIKDSIVSIALGDSDLVPIESLKDTPFEGGRKCTVYMTTPGKESHISVYARKV